MGYRVTLTIETLPEVGPASSTFRVETGIGEYALPLVLRVANAALAAFPGEIASITAAAKVITDALNGAGMVTTRSTEGGE